MSVKRVKVYVNNELDDSVMSNVSFSFQIDIKCPFDNFDKNVVLIIDAYASRKIYNFLNHWMFCIGVSKDIQHATESACIHQDVCFIRSVFSERGHTLNYEPMLRIVRKHGYKHIEKLIQQQQQKI